MLPYEVTGRLPIELFAHLGADVEPPLTADAQAFGLGEFVMQRPARQVLGQWPAAMGPAAAALLRGRLGWARLLRGRTAGLRLLLADDDARGKQQQLIGVITLALGPEQPPEQLIHPLPRFGQIPIALPQGHQQFDDHALAGRQIIGKMVDSG
jgi:hypothetical protein